MAKHGNESRELLLKIRLEKIKGNVVKRFEGEFFAFDLLKILYDDSEDRANKTELLILLEEYGHHGLKPESIDQFVTSLLDIYHQAVDNVANWTFVCQALVTSTSLLIQLQQLYSEICGQLIHELVSIVTSRVNQPDSQRLRSCACQCLTHMEEFQPGILSGHLDEFLQLTKQERTQVFQDYAVLSAKVMEHAIKTAESSPGSPGVVKTKSTAKLSRTVSIDPGDLRQTTALMLENISLFTSCGSLSIIQSLIELAKIQEDISPMMFKSLVLHQMSTMSCVLFHTVLYIQRQFPQEILTTEEEYDLVDRLCIMADHPCLNVLHKLLASQWIKTFQQNENGQLVPHDCIKRRHRLRFYPSVFDPVDTQLSKLYLTSFCSNTDQDTDGMETSILLGSLGCLHKLVWHTGSGRAAVALFKALYYMYTLHNSHAFATDIQRFVRGLISEFPHFIPNSIDFIDSIQELNIDSAVYVETLSLLHQQVATATKEQIYNSYQFYLQILKKVAIETTIDQSSTLKLLYFLTENAAEIDDSSWKLGHELLEICRNLMTFHGTQQYYIGKKSSLVSMDVSERERKRSSHMLYTLENFFVIDPNRPSSFSDDAEDTDGDQQELANLCNDMCMGIKRKRSSEDSRRRRRCSRRSDYEEERDELLSSGEVTTEIIEIPIDYDKDMGDSHSENASPYKPYTAVESKELIDAVQISDNSFAGIAFNQCNTGSHIKVSQDQECSIVEQTPVHVFAEVHGNHGVDNCMSTAGNNTEFCTVDVEQDDDASLKGERGHINEDGIFGADHPLEDQTPKPKTDDDILEQQNNTEECTDITVIDIDDCQKENDKVREEEHLINNGNEVKVQQGDTFEHSHEGTMQGQNIEDKDDIESEYDIANDVDEDEDNDDHNTFLSETVDDPLNSSLYQDIAMSLIGLTIYEPDQKERKGMQTRRQEKTVKDVIWFSFCFLVCIIPRLVLDVITVVKAGSGHLDHVTTRTLVVSSETGLSIMLFVFNATFLWRYKVYKDE